jgi:integrase
MAPRRAPGEGSIFKRKDGRWVGAIPAGRDLQGKPRRIFVYGRTRRAAVERKKARELELGISAHLDAERATAGDLFDRWLAMRGRDLRPSSQRAYKDSLERFAQALRPIALRRITTLDLDMHFQQLQQAGTSAARVRFVRSVLSIAFGQAVRWRLIPYNPVRETMPPKVTSAKPTVWEPQEAAAFLAHAREHCPWWPLYLLALATGMRRGELAGLRPEDVHLDEGEILVRRARVYGGGGPVELGPKTARGRRQIRFRRDVARILGWWLKERERWRRAAQAIGLWHDSGYLFVWQDGRPISPNTISMTFRRLARAAGLPPIRFHDLRHTHAVLELAAGLPLPALSERLGHRDASFTMRVYADYVPRAKREPLAPTLAELLETPGGRTN